MEASSRIIRVRSHRPNIANSNAGVLLLTIDKIPSWYGDNPYIHNYYRPVFASVTPCFQSWLYLHNQSANIYTHLIPGILALFLNGGLFWLFKEYYPDATFWDRAVFHVYLTSCSLCFGTSAAYHTLLCHSHEFADLWVRLDYVSISVLILGSFVPGLYMGFYCEPLLLRGYLTMIFAMGIYNGYSSLQDRFGDQDWIKSRLAPFVGMGLSAFIPIIHAAFIFPYDQLQKQSGLNYYYLEGILMVIGVLFLASRFPERWLPGTFDLCGSHTIFHCFIVAGTLSHFVGIWSGYDWNYTHQRCALP
ncbi:adiponectin receptor protein [Sarocladium strictum]